MPPRWSVRRLRALVAAGALLLAVSFPLVSWWRFERRLSRVFELKARLDARVVPRPVPAGSVEEAFGCAFAVIKPLPRDVPALHRNWDDQGPDPLQPWFDGAQPLSTLPPGVKEALRELEPAMVELRSCAGARELARGQANLTAHNRKLLRIGRGTRLVVVRALLEGRPSDAARVCVETLAVFADATAPYGSTGVTRIATTALMPACIEALRRQPKEDREALRRAWETLPGRLPSNQEVLEDRLTNTVPLRFRELLTPAQRQESEFEWGRTRAELDLATLWHQSRELARAERAFDDVLSLRDEPGPARAEASAAVDRVMSTEADSLALDAELQSLEKTRLALSLLSALARGAPLPAGVTLSERALSVSTGPAPWTLAIPPFEALSSR